MDELEHYRAEMTKEAINELPVVSYAGPVHLVQREDELIPALEKLQHDTLLGFDTEVRPCFVRGREPYPVSLLQLAGERCVVLVRLNKVPLSKPLLDLLCHPGVLKLGVAIGDDMRLLRRKVEFAPSGVIDLGLSARAVNIKTQGLRTLAANFLRVRISKTAQCSNWEAAELSPLQIRYAATDAWIGREIYLKMSTVAGMRFQCVQVPEPPAGKRRRTRRAVRSAQNRPASAIVVPE